MHTNLNNHSQPFTQSDSSVSGIMEDVKMNINMNNLT